ncbi:MAG: flagellar hook-basal body protein, partial [Planctomycetota bacterium]
MLKAFSTAATGMTGQQMMVDVIANNLANVNTTGGTEVASGINSPSGIEIGSGVRAASTVKVFTTGELQNTSRPLDIAITGDGFLQVTTPNGDLRYTRDGSLQINANGELVTTNGYAIEPAISVPTDAVSVSIEKDGGVNVTDSAGTQSVVGTVQLVRFANSSGLSNEGDNLLSESEASGTPTTGTPGENGFGTIQSGFLEKSNVQMVTELVNL